MIPFTVLAEVVILSNYPLRKSNLEKIVNEENYKEIAEIVRKIEDVKDVYFMEEEGKVLMYIERYPILKKIEVKGNFAFPKEEILSYLGLYEGIPIRGQELDEKDIEQRVKELYKEKGFLDASVGATVAKDEEGYVELYMGIDEGPVYFTKGGIYKGSSYEPSLLDLKIGLVKGRVFRESFFKESVFSLQDFYIEEGFWDNFVFYEGVEKEKVRRPFYEVLFPEDRSTKKSPLRWLGSLSEGFSNLMNHPIGTLKALAGRGYAARPVFQIIEGKRYRISAEGAKFFSAEDLIKISQLERKGVDPFSLEEAKENILSAYYRKGFFDAEVSYDFHGEEITFKIKEGQRYTILGEKFQGDFYDEDKLEDYLRSQIDELYKRGYTLAEGSINKEILKDKKAVKVRFNIEPGKRQILKEFLYKGDRRELKRIFNKHSEKLPAIFNTELIELLNLDIQRYFLRRGYMEGDFDIQVQLEETEDSVYYSYIYEIKEGPSYKLGETLYYGYDKTSLRELSYMTEKAEYYSETLNDKTLYNMLNSDIFLGVSIDTFIDKDKKLVHRLIQLTEDKRGILDFSLGYNTEENIAFEGFLGLKNLFGMGLASGLRYKRSGKRELYDLSFSDNFLFSRKNWFKANLFKSYEEHKSYNLDSKGFNFQLGYRITSNTSIGPVFSILNNKVDGQSFRIKKYGLFLLREFKDDIFSPNRIHYDSINLSFAEGSSKYVKFDLSTFYLLPLAKGFKLSFKVSGGAVSKEAPIFERFFLGGFKDLRGYSFEEIGQPTGGRYYTFGRLELSRTIKEPFIGTIFGDVGSVGDRLKDLPKGVKVSLGGGVGVNTPIGPVRLDVAFPVEEGWLKKYKIYFSVGYYY
ncbi:MAG: BamA/TamA family outer membrane protein [Aquificaceae bacterium]